MSDYDRDGNVERQRIHEIALNVARRLLKVLEIGRAAPPQIAADIDATARVISDIQHDVEHVMSLQPFGATLDTSVLTHILTSQQHALGLLEQLENARGLRARRAIRPAGAAALPGSAGLSLFRKLRLAPKLCPAVGLCPERRVFPTRKASRRTRASRKPCPKPSGPSRNSRNPLAKRNASGRRKATRRQHPIPRRPPRVRQRTTRPGQRRQMGRQQGRSMDCHTGPARGPAHGQSFPPAAGMQPRQAMPNGAPHPQSGPAPFYSGPAPAGPARSRDRGTRSHSDRRLSLSPRQRPPAAGVPSRAAKAAFKMPDFAGPGRAHVGAEICRRRRRSRGGYRVARRRHYPSSQRLDRQAQQCRPGPEARRTPRS